MPTRRYYDYIEQDGGPTRRITPRPVGAPPPPAAPPPPTTNSGSDTKFGDFDNKDKGFTTPDDYGAPTSPGDYPPRGGVRPVGGVRYPGQPAGPQDPTRPPIDQYTSWSSNTSYTGGLFDAPNFGDLDPTVREVQDEELVENRLTNLLASDSRYIRQAREDARLAAAERGGLNTNLWGESGVSAAIRAAGAIAESDANAYRITASENMQARNVMTQAKLQSLTQITTAQMSAGATIAAAQINAETARYLAEVNNEHDKAMFGLRAGHEVDMFGRSIGHDVNMENLRQGGRVELTQMSHDQQAWLQDRGFQHDFSMADLSFDQRVEFEELFGQPRWQAELDFQRTQSQTSVALGLMSMYAQGMMSLNGQDIDPAAFARGETFFRGLWESGMSLLKNLWGDDFDFTIDFGGPT